jgi:hypothetical protein
VGEGHEPGREDLKPAKEPAHSTRDRPAEEEEDQHDDEEACEEAEKD